MGGILDAGVQRWGMEFLYQLYSENLASKLLLSGETISFKCQVLVLFLFHSLS